MKKSKYFASMFFIYWGVLFGGIPLVILCSAGEESKESFWFLLIFVLIGFCAVAYGVFNLIKIIKDKRILKNGKSSIGHFVNREGCGAYNGVNMFRIIFNYKDEQGNFVQTKTSEIFTIDEVEKYAQSKSFEIKYSKNHAVIVPNGKIVFSSDKNLCKYCGSEYLGDRCPSCGAKTSNN